MKKTLYLDMDGVVADFNTAAMLHLGASTLDSDNAAQAGRWPRTEWEKLKEIENFYRILPKTAMADQLVSLARRFRDELDWNLYFLTAIPKDNDVPECFQDKIEWVQEYYPDIRVHFGPYSKDKQQHCRPGDILVDDRKDNYNQWLNAGGTAILVTKDYTSVLDQLEKIFLTQLKT